MAAGTPRGANDPDETLLQAIEQGLSDDQLAAEPELAEAVAAHRKLESLFDLLRQPAGFPGGIPNNEPTPERPMPARIGRYIVRRVLGQGTFGTVYLADDPELNRQVAIKAPRAGRFATVADADKFLDEARHAAGLKHPGIVAIYDAGRDGADCYIVQEYVAGHTLGEVMQGERLSHVAVARLLAEIADALNYAHQHGFVHRDLKPANIMVSLDGNSPKLLDFGLAVSRETQAHLAGHVAGTPAYMAPEQVRGETDRLDGRADIWGLGVIAYQLLTDRQPFWRGDVKTCLDEIQYREPKWPRQIDEMIPTALERVTLRCLFKSPTARYGAAADIAADLRRWLTVQGDRSSGEWPMLTTAELATFSSAEQDLLEAFEAQAIQTSKMELADLNTNCQIRPQYAKTYRVLRRDGTRTLLKMRGVLNEGPTNGMSDVFNLALLRIYDRVISRKLVFMAAHFRATWHEDIENWAGKEGSFIDRSGCLLQLISVGAIAGIGLSTILLLIP